MTTLFGIILVALAGIGTGTGIWSMKKLKRLRFEHYWFVAMLLGLLIIPWTIVLLRVPHPLEAYSQVGWEVLLKANFFALLWGVANVLCGLCMVRIGAALTGAIMPLGIVVGATLPMVMKGTGLFANSPDLLSRGGLILMVGLAVILCGVTISTFAGFGRDKALAGTRSASLALGRQGSFVTGLVMAIISGFTSAGSALCFVYGQAPIKEAMLVQGVDSVTSDVAVWAAALLSGALVNIAYPAWIMTKNKNWGELFKHPGEALLSTVGGIQLMASFILLGRGMLLLGVFGASVGFAIQQIMQIMGNQTVGFLFGEWKNIYGKPRRLLYTALVVLAVAVLIVAFSNSMV